MSVVVRDALLACTWYDIQERRGNAPLQEWQGIVAASLLDQSKISESFSLLLA